MPKCLKLPYNAHLFLLIERRSRNGKSETTEEVIAQIFVMVSGHPPSVKQMIEIAFFDEYDQTDNTMSTRFNCLAEIRLQFSLYRPSFAYYLSKIFDSTEFRVHGLARRSEIFTSLGMPLKFPGYQRFEIAFADSWASNSK
jgi:hypothetical protein